MECTATCRICGVKLSCKEGNVCNALGMHLLKKHPELEMAHFDMVNYEGARCKKPSRNSVASSLLKRSSTLLRSRKCPGQRKSVYRTTVESWRPGCAPLQCPRCGTCAQPLIRKQRNKIAYNSLGAFFLLGCWPLCFLPMLMCGGTSTILCCRHCGFCFGTYDIKKGKLIPASKDAIVEPPDIC